MSWRCAPSSLATIVVRQLQKFMSLHREEIKLETRQALLAKFKQQALEFQLSQQYQKALVVYQKLLNLDRTDPYIWNNIGIIYYLQFQYEEALQAVKKSLELDPFIYLHYYSLGLILEKLDNTSEAIQAYERTIQLNQNYINAYNNLGNLMLKSGQLDAAISVYTQALKIDKKHVGTYLNLGNCLVMQNKLDEAIQVYQNCLKIQPLNADVFHNLALIFHRKGDTVQANLNFGYSVYCQQEYVEAIKFFSIFLRYEKGDRDLYLTLAKCHRGLNHFDEAIKTYRQAIHLYPDQAIFYSHLDDMLQDFGMHKQAWDVVTEASNKFPDVLRFKFRQFQILPILYETVEEIEFCRDRFSTLLTQFIEESQIEFATKRKKLLDVVCMRTNFYLQYQGKNDLNLQKQYGKFVHQIISSNFLDCLKEMQVQSLEPERKIKIGYISAHFTNHVVGRMCLGWLRHCDQNKFTNVCYYIERTQDSTTEKFKLYSDRFYQISQNLNQLIEQILADRLDVLVFPSIGMHPLATALAGLRLAPVQCTTWAHPTTSGSPTIDYFLSSDLMEPEDGNHHYSETLIRLSNLGFSFSKPVVPDALLRRSEFNFKYNLREDSILYLSCQSIYKYLPQYDYIFPAIAQQIPQAQFIFIEASSSHYVTNQFVTRLENTFQAHGLRCQNYCTVVPRQNYAGYFSLHVCADIFLDTLGWSGGNTTIDAITCGLPIVTYPGELMRGRHAYGMLKMLGITETIAQTEQNYIDIAVRLGLDKQWRRTIAEKMISNHDRLFEDLACVRDLEAFYQQVSHNISSYPNT